MNDDAENGDGGLINVKATIKVPGGKLDQAAAELLTTALGAPAGETSSMIGDVIGLLGDRIKVYRAENRVYCLFSARERLRKKGVTLAQAKRLSEGEVYDLLDGMSGADTPRIREMWAGLMANAMDPSNDVSADKGYISVLEALSSNDAKIMEFLSAHLRYTIWATTQEEKLRQEHHMAASDSELEAHKNNQISTRLSAKEKYQRLKVLFVKLGIEDIQSDKISLLNLRRLGIIETIGTDNGFQGAHFDRSGELKALAAITDQIAKRVKAIERVVSATDNNVIDVVITNSGAFDVRIKFTPFGEQFVAVCGLLITDVQNEH